MTAPRMCSFLRTLRTDFPAGGVFKAIWELAEAIGVAPSVVLGQAQRRTGDYSWGHRLKRRVDLGANALQ